MNYKNSVHSNFAKVIIHYLSLNIYKYLNVLFDALLLKFIDTHFAGKFFL